MYTELKWLIKCQIHLNALQCIKRRDEEVFMKEKVFVNRILNMKRIKYIGLDMDHTLIRYHSEKVEALVYKLAVERLILLKNYPKAIESFQFHFDDAIRGLVIDSKNGNILKLSRYGAIRQSYHGTHPIEFNNQQHIYRTIYVDLNDPNYMVIDTSFSISFAVLYSQLVDYKDTHPEALPSYQEIAHDVLKAVDRAHADGSLKSTMSANFDGFVIKDKAVVEGLLWYQRHGKKIFLLTNSDYHYTRLMLDYAINPFMPKGQTWRDLFEIVVTLANKPRFFYDNLKFLKVNPENGTMTNFEGIIEPGIYQGGCASKFTQDLHLNGDEILYIGDHIYGDIVRLKKDCNWRTALVVEELGFEIAAQMKTLTIEQQIISMMQVKRAIETAYVDLCTRRIDEQTDAYDKEIQSLQSELTTHDEKIAKLLASMREHFNPKWDRVFRAGAEESFFAYQVDRFACIYMEKLSDLLEHSPLTYFRAKKRPLAHDLMIVNAQS